MLRADRRPDRSRRELEELRARLEEAEATLRAIRNGEVDAVVVSGPAGDQVFTLQSADRPYRVFVEEMNDGAATLSAAGAILYCNGRFAEIVRAPLDRVIGASFVDFVEPAERAALASLLQKGLMGRVAGEVTVRAADGTTVPLRLSLSLLPTGFIGVVCVVATDLTETRQREEDLRHARDQLEDRVAERTAALTESNRKLAASRAAALKMMEETAEAKRALEVLNRDLEREIAERQRKEEEIRQLNAQLEQRVRQRTAELEAANLNLESFSYSVSHDLRAPLRHIEGFSRVLVEDHAPQLAPDVARYLERIRAAAQQMGQLIEDLLGLARVTRQEMTVAEVDLSDLVGAIETDLRAGSPHRSVTVTIAPGVFARGDARLLRVALENLLNNAWKYTSKHVCAHIEFGRREERGESVYFVRDDGAGFDMAFVDRLFGAFQRLHSQAEFEGTGIGLATVERIIRRHGGRIWAEGAPGRGAVFSFTLGDLPHRD